MYPKPLPQPTPAAGYAPSGRAQLTGAAGYANRWRWWYESIIDWMIANPHGDIKDCAVSLGKHPQTISLITKTDLFKEHFARRRAEWRERHDFAIISKTTKVAEQSLDLLLDRMEKKRDSVPIEMLERISTSALDRLGYSPKAAPAVQFNNTVQTNVIQAAVTPELLEEARAAMRNAEHRRALDAASQPRAWHTAVIHRGDVDSVCSHAPGEAQELAPGEAGASAHLVRGGEDGDQQEDLRAPLPISS
jgi:hypothetical protein